MDKKEIALGKGVASSGVAAIKKPQTVEDRLTALEEKIHAITIAFHATRNMLAKKESPEVKADPHFGQQPTNKDGVPLNSTLIGITKGVPYILVVNELGEYLVGNNKYHSLSAAAEAVSGVRRSGWTFWKTAEGITVKEAFRK